jgi:putative membrane protein
MFYMHNFGWGWWMVMSIGMVAFWVLLIYGIFWLVRGGQDAQKRGAPPPETPETPEQILKRRLAQGEISIEEYRRLAEALEQEPPRHPVAA